MSEHMSNITLLSNEKEWNTDRLVRIALIAAITWWSISLIKPFLGLLIWGFILAIALHPAYLWLNKRIGRRPVFSAGLLTLFSLSIIIGTVTMLTNNMVDTLTELIKHVRSGERVIPLPPAEVAHWPFIGEQLYQSWTLASSNIGELINQYAGYLVNASSMLLSRFAGTTLDLVIFILSIIFSGYLLTYSAPLITTARAFTERIAPRRGHAMMTILKDTIQSVSIGIIGIALFQALLFGVLVLLAKVPGAGLLTFIALVFGITQIGLLILVIPVAIWLFMSQSITVAIVYTLLLSSTAILDSFLKPFVLTRGLHTPMIVILLGVIGGLLLHGLLGVFIGPVVLALFYDLVINWLDMKPSHNSNRSST